MGLLRIHVYRGVNLAVRDVVSSDPYVVIKMGKQVNFFFFCSILLLGFQDLMFYSGVLSFSDVDFSFVCWFLTCSSSSV